MRIRELIEMMPKDGWKLHVGGYLRRGNQCPITSITGNDANDVNEVIDKLLIPKSMAELIVGAADSYANCDKHLQQLLREELLNA